MKTFLASFIFLLSSLAYSQPPTSASFVLGQPNFTSSATATSQSGLFFPGGMAIDSHNYIWVADSNNNRILEFTPPYYNGMSASLVLGQPTFTIGSVVSASQSSINFNGGVSRLLLVDAIAFDSAGNLWVADTYNNRVLMFAYPFSNNQQASLVLGQPNFTTTTPGLTVSGLSEPRGVFVDKLSNVWVADTGNSRVLEYSYPITQNGQAASLVLGQPSFTFASILVSSSSLHSPFGVYVDSSSNVWVSDTFNYRVLEFVPPLFNGAAASLVLGNSNFTTNNPGGSSAATMNYPVGVSIDGAGNLWTAQWFNQRIAGFSVPYSSGEAASLLLGESSFTSSPGGTSASTISFVSGLAVDSGNDVWAVDSTNSRILAFGLPLAPTNFSATTVGFSSISWTWGAVSNVNGYYVYNSSTSAVVGTSSTTSFSQTGLIPNTLYSDVVAASSGTMPGLATSVVSTYTFASPPINLQFNVVGSTYAVVFWSDNGNPPNTNYDVLYWETSGSTITISTTNTFSDLNSLSPLTTYYFTVNAYNVNNIESPSNVVVSTVTP